MAQASKAILPVNTGGSPSKRIGVSVSGSMSGDLTVGAYATPSSGADRYSLVVLNQADTLDGDWNPQPITATITFRGLQAKYTFPVGVTTLLWDASTTANTTSIAKRSDQSCTLKVKRRTGASWAKRH